MSGSPKTRCWRALAALAAILAVLILLLPQASSLHTAPVLAYLLVPIFLFGSLDTTAPQPAPPQISPDTRYTPARPSLFQRPPPLQS
jgi:hypothetical protein